MEKLIAVAAIALFFLITPTPEIVSFTPTQSLNTEIISMTIEGEKFDQSAVVKLSQPDGIEINASENKVLSENKIVCKFDLKGQKPGKWDLIVANTDRITKRQKRASVSEGFTIEYPAPVVAKISPERGENSGIIKIESLTGSNFRTGASVMLSNDKMEIGASRIEIISGNKLSCQFNLLNAEIGTYNVKVVNDDGKTGVLKDAFVVQGPPPKKALRPEITAITPNRGFNNGYVLTTITGANFQPEAAVKLVGPGPVELPGLNVKVESASQITCFFDIKGQPVGKYHVEVTNPGGQKAVLLNGFTVEVMNVSLNNTLKPVFFDLNKDNLKPGDTDRLDSNLKTLSANPKLFILLGGHADERGSTSYNLDLSRRRAENIKKYLVSKGIDPKRITIYAYGKGHPLKQGHDESAWRYNRRVDIMVWEEPPTRDMGLKGIKVE